MRLSEKKIGGIVGVLNRYQNALAAGKASDHLFGPHQAPTAPRAFSFDRARGHNPALAKVIDDRRG